MFPEYQRLFTWKAPRASRLIITVLSKRFIPPVVLHEAEQGKHDVVDGTQRASSLFSFYFGEHAREHKLPNTTARLSGFEEGKEVLNGMQFDDNPEVYRREFINYSLATKMIPMNTPEEDVFSIYEDINSGGGDLTPQQLRWAAYAGPYMKLIGELRDNTDFNAIRGEKDLEKETDGEVILRAFAFNNKEGRASYKGSLEKILNKGLLKFSKMSKPDQNAYSKNEKATSQADIENVPWVSAHTASA